MRFVCLHLSLSTSKFSDFASNSMVFEVQRSECLVNVSAENDRLFARLKDYRKGFDSPFPKKTSENRRTWKYCHWSFPSNLIISKNP